MPSGRVALLIATATGESARLYASTGGNIEAVDQTTNEVFELDAGASIAITTQKRWDTLLTDTMSNLKLEVLDDNSATVIRTFSLTTPAHDGVVANEVVTFFATSTGASGGTAKAGTYRLRTKFDLDHPPDGTRTFDSDGGGTLFTGYTRANVKGYLRAGVDLTAISISQVIGGSTPSTFGWPDRVRVRASADCSALDSEAALTFAAKTLSGTTTTVVRTGTGTPGVSNSVWDVNHANLDLNTTDPTTFGLRFGDFQNSALSGRPWTHFTNVPAGWTGSGTDGGAQTTKHVAIHKTGAFSYSSACTLALQSQPDADKRYNRGERLPLAGNITVRLLNARGEAFTARSADEFRVKDTAGGGTLEDTFAIASHDHGTGDHALNIAGLSSTMLASTNTAFPIGARTKVVRWKDTAANSPEAQTASIGDVFSAYASSLHLQVNNNTLDAALNTTQVLTPSDVVFYAVKITGARGQVIDGATGGRLAFQDDASLKSVFLGTAGLATGPSGYTALQSDFERISPGGGWDAWWDGSNSSAAFTKDGNTASKARPAAGSTDFVLLVKDPGLIVAAGLTPTASGAEKDHIHPGDSVRATARLWDIGTRKAVAPDAGSFRAVILRYNPVDGGYEYLASDGVTWSDWTTGAADEHELAETASGSNIFAKDFTATSGWGSIDLLSIVVRCTLTATPYHFSVARELVDKKNRHDRYAFDPTGIQA